VHGGLMDIFSRGRRRGASATARKTIVRITIVLDILSNINAMVNIKEEQSPAFEM
jgi:hypothetical protein